ncbi:hypothetical protein K503DRAFT_788084 [Rhizopogon vinicolor AM-OR11-026]|uniref:Uncharacterized protein n=1 Tax=Rhizopogon vinicolor AM-OR11-026 TaxID=1314800 RepID=A0A1B7MEM4_9AGAM|nr:hypothetical protein K503DRAFT_788084 [Rhizopogon vinicolor AM-OR11-026]
MGKQSRENSARNANLVKAMLKKTKINNENKEDLNDEVDKLSPSTEEELQHEVEDHVSELTHMEAHEYKESEISQVNTLRDGQKRLLPTIFACQKVSDLTEIINPHRKNGWYGSNLDAAWIQWGTHAECPSFKCNPDILVAANVVIHSAGHLISAGLATAQIVQESPEELAGKISTFLEKSTGRGIEHTCDTLEVGVYSLDQ